ncbi:SMI1/KNR4 family protein OS=Streptomyces sp. ACT-1 OX=1609288 GN=SACT1_3403 PE=4 SV=1 [Streptomyces griseus subsp. griseus]
MWVVRTERGVCAFVLVDGDSEANLSEARSLTLEFDSFLVGQGY